MPRPARARYLRIAMDLAVRQQGGRHEVPYLAARVQLADVAAALGRTRTALYRQWETQHDFWVDLTLYLAYQDDLTQNPEDMPWHAAAEVLAGMRVAADEAVELVRVFGNAGHGELDANPWFLVRAGLLGYPDVPGLADLRRQVEERRIQLLGGFSDAVLASIGRTPLPQFTSDDLATILWCAADAQRVRRHFLSGLDDLWWFRTDEGAGPKDWSLWAFLSRAVLFDLSRPAPSDLDRPPATPSPTTPIMDPFARWNPLQREALAVATDLLLADLLAGRGAPSLGNGSAGIAADGRARDLAVLGHVTIARVAAAAGVSRRAVYDVWPTRTDMLLELLREEVTARRMAMLDAVKRAVRGGLDAADVPALIDAVIWWHPERPPGPDLVLAFVPAAGDPRVRRIIAEGHGRYLGEFAGHVEHIVGASGRRVRADIGSARVALLWLSLIEGGRRLRRTNPAALRPATAGRPSALGAAAQAIFDHATVPA